MSILTNEVEKFTSLASKWWDYEGPFKLLHEINPLRLEYILEQIKSHFQFSHNEEIAKLKILDVGCGGGILSLPLARLGAKVKGIDAGEENIVIAAEKAKSENVLLDFENIDITNLAEKSEKFDVVICLEVLEHVDNPRQFISYISALAKENGLVILSTINRNIKSKILAIGFAEYILNMVPKGTHEYQKFITPYELKQYCAESDLGVIDLRGMSLDIRNHQWKISRDLGINYFATFKKMSSFI